VEILLIRRKLNGEYERRKEEWTKASKKVGGIRKWRADLEFV